MSKEQNAASTKHEYTWKHGISIRSNRSLRFDKPLEVGTVFADLLTGEAYRVHSIYPAKELDRAISTMPEEVAHTFPMRHLTEEELRSLREKHKFQADETLRPQEEFVILPSAP